MVINADVIEISKEFISILESKNIHIREAYIFGSYAKGNATKFSDIDLALISSSFSGIRIDDNIKIIKNTPPTFTDIETHPFSIEDFNENNPYVREILKTGYKLI